MPNRNEIAEVQKRIQAELARRAAIHPAPPRPRDENGRFVPGMIFDHARRGWVLADQEF